MVIRNKEERTNSIWQFIAVATIPLLLLFLAGFSLGNTAGKEKTATRQQLEDAEKKIAELEAKLLAQDSFFRRGDAILSPMDEKVGELDKELRLLAGQIAENGDLLADWQSDVNKYFRKTSLELENLEIDFSANNKELPPAIKKGLFYFEEYLNLNKNILGLREMLTVGKAKEGKSDDLANMMAELEKKDKAFKEQSAAQMSELKIMNLQTQLDKCKDDLTRMNQSAAASSKSPNPAYKAKILSEVDAIRNEILPNMRTTFIGNDSKKIEPLREKLRGKLDIIGQNADRIE